MNNLIYLFSTNWYVSLIIWHFIIFIIIYISIGVYAIYGRVEEENEFILNRDDGGDIFGWALVGVLLTILWPLMDTIIVIMFIKLLIENGLVYIIRKFKFKSKRKNKFIWQDEEYEVIE